MMLIMMIMNMRTGSLMVDASPELVADTASWIPDSQLQDADEDDEDDDEDDVDNDDHEHEDWSSDG